LRNISLIFSTSIVYPQALTGRLIIAGHDVVRFLRRANPQHRAQHRALVHCRVLSSNDFLTLLHLDSIGCKTRSKECNAAFFVGMKIEKSISCSRSYWNEVHLHLIWMCRPTDTGKSPRRFAGPAGRDGVVVMIHNLMRGDAS
jgi:hypothetical protein